MKVFSNLDYFKIAIANHYGLTKETWEKRIAFCDELDITHRNSFGLYWDMSIDAEEPILMRKALRALEDAIEGKPTGFPMALDATTSGPQILACLAGCKKSGYMTNLVDPSKRIDLYSEAIKATGVDLNRDDVKSATMTSFYASTAQPKKVFGEGTPQLEAFYNMLETQLTGAYSLLNDILSCWNSEALNHTWELPDGHRAFVPVTVTKEDKVEIDLLKSSFTHIHKVVAASDYNRSLPANLTHSFDGYIVREIVARSRYNVMAVYNLATKFAKYLGVPNLEEKCPMGISRVISTPEIMRGFEDLARLSEQDLHHINWRLHYMLSHKPYDVLPIHDSFASLVPYVNHTRINYANILTEIACTDSLQTVLRQITGEYDLVYTKEDNSLWSYIQDSNYAIC